MKKIIWLILCAFLLFGCASEKKYERTVFSMDTHIKLSVYAKNADALLDEAEKEIKRINDKFGLKNTERIPSEADDETKILLNKAQEIKESTKGAFDINVAPVMKVWGFHSDEFSEKKYRVPTATELAEALNVAHEEQQIDLGGIAKGYCADKVTELLKNNGVRNAVLSFGGNVSLIGKSPVGKDWTVGIQNPFGEGIYATIYTSDTAVVTSGDYIRFFEKDGIRYHHIINPETGYPVQNELASVTVITKSGTYADALSTALFVMGKDNSVKYWNDHKDFEMVLITKDGNIHCTENVNIHTDKKINIIR